MKILANDGISDLGKELLEKAGFTVITEKVPQEELAKAVNEQGIEMVLVRSATTVRKEVIDSCPGLKLIGRGGVGMDNIDVAYAREKGITVINTPASSSQSVAELVMGHMFAISRFLHDSYKNMETGDFSVLKKNYGKGVELRGKTLGIIGFGRIGQSLASYALGCGMNVIAVDRHTEPLGNLRIGRTPQQHLQGSVLLRCHGWQGRRTTAPRTPNDPLHRHHAPLKTRHVQSQAHHLIMYRFHRHDRYLSATPTDSTIT